MYPNSELKKNALGLNVTKLPIKYIYRVIYIYIYYPYPLYTYNLCDTGSGLGARREIRREQWWRWRRRRMSKLSWLSRSPISRVYPNNNGTTPPRTAHRQMTRPNEPDALGTTRCPTPPSLPEILSQAASLPEDLLFILLAPLVTPHKGSRDHHLLLTSSNTAAAVDYIRHVLPLSPPLSFLPLFNVDWRLTIVDYVVCIWIEDGCDFGGWENHLLGSCQGMFFRRGVQTETAVYNNLETAQRRRPSPLSPFIWFREIDFDGRRMNR